MNLTDWYPGSVNPVHVGVYECTWPNDHINFFNFWDGKQWHWGASSISRAYEIRDPRGPLAWDQETNRRPERWLGVAK